MTSRGPRNRSDEFLATIEDETDRLATLVGNLLDMSRLASRSRADGLPPDRTRRGSAQGGRDGHAAVAGGRCGHPRIVATREGGRQPARERALANLIDNAIVHSPPGKVVRVDAGRARQPRHSADNRSGAGDQGEGPGQGLRAVPAGRRRRPRTGGRDWVWLLRRDSSRRWADGWSSQTLPVAGLTAVVSLGGRQMTSVLVVDDETQILKTLRTNLKARGYRGSHRGRRRDRLCRWRHGNIRMS